MTKLTARFAVDQDGNRTDLLLPIEEHQRILGEPESIRAFEAVIAPGNEAIRAKRVFADPTPPGHRCHHPPPRRDPPRPARIYRNLLI